MIDAAITAQMAEAFEGACPSQEPQSGPAEHCLPSSVQLVSG